MTFILGIAYMLVMGAVIVSMAVLLLKGKKAEYNRMYFVCQGLVVVWCVSQILILLSKTDGELKFSYQLGNIGVCFIGSAWYYFAVAYTGAEKSARWHWIPGVVSGIHYLMFLTNPWHFHYYTSFSMDEIQHGIFFYTNVAANYLFVAWGSLLLYLRLKEENKRTRQLIIASACVPLLLNAVYLTGVVKPSFDITPLGFGISGILVLFATIRYRFLEVNITAFDVILSGLEQGVAIFNPRGECTYSNESFFRLLALGQEGSLTRNVVGKRLEQMQFLEQEDNVFLDEQERYLQVQTYEPVSQSIWGHRSEEEKMLVYMVSDISRYYEMMQQTRELAATNERLALEKERNRIAQQVHDTAGHTLTMIQSYMKLASVSAKKQETEKVEEYLWQAKTLSSEGIRELRQSINQLRKEASYELVTQGIVQLADQVKEIPVEVTIQGEDSEQYSHLYRVLYDSARESVTNALKYSGATKMEIIIRFQTDQVELIICDDGNGCEKLQENNGIRGIRERVENAGGTVRFLTAKGEGFLTRIKVPANGMSGKETVSMNDTYSGVL